MLTLEEIAQRIEVKADYTFDKRKYDWHPITVDDYVLPEFKIIESNANGADLKLRLKLSKVLAFIESVKHRRAKTGCTIMPISLTSRSNRLIWNSGTSIANGIAFMKKIGLISTESEYYRFNAYNKNENFSKTYRYYKENEDKLKAYCEERGIKPYCRENPLYSSFDIAGREPSIDVKKVRFSSKLKLIKQSHFTNKEFEKLLTLCLYENYPGLRFFIEKANEINKTYYKNYPEFQIKFQPRFTWSKNCKYVKGIGIRATNSLINVKKEDRAEVL